MSTKKARKVMHAVGKRTSYFFGSGNSSQAKSINMAADGLDASYQRWISKQMEKRVLDYSDLETISVFCGTWNVNAKEVPENCNLKDWLLPEGTEEAAVYVIGLQEMCDLNVMNVVINNAMSDEKSHYWLEKFKLLFNTFNNKYTMLMEKHMVGIQLAVFIKTELCDNVHDVRASATYTGGYGVSLGNKGGISIRLDIFDSAVCFVCAHFHASRDNVPARNQDFHQILETAIFLPDEHSKETREGLLYPVYKGEIEEGQVESYHGRGIKNKLNILNHEHVFWLGDLNYRISAEIDTMEVFDVVMSGAWATLRPKDQLNLERLKENIFQRFEEGLLDFPPSYKFQPGTSEYETRPDKKLRAPAWCDRVLWRSANRNSVRQTKYFCASSLEMSDHKPVGACFELDVRKVVMDRVRAVYQELLFSVDKWVNAATPKMDLEGRNISFGNVTYGQKHRETMKLVNTGPVMAEWQFVPKNDDSTICQPWLRLSPIDGILAPNETTDIEVTVDMSLQMAVDIVAMAGKSIPVTLDDIVILRVMKGNDLFCMINAVIDPLCYDYVKHMLPTPPSHLKNSHESLNHLKAIEENSDDEQNLKVEQIYGKDSDDED